MLVVLQKVSDVVVVALKNPLALGILASQAAASHEAQAQRGVYPAVVDLSLPDGLQPLHGKLDEPPVVRKDAVAPVSVQLVRTHADILAQAEQLAALVGDHCTKAIFTALGEIPNTEHCRLQDIIDDGLRHY